MLPTIFRGKAVNEKAKSGNVAVVNISNISETGIDHENLNQIEEERKVSRYILSVLRNYGGCFKVILMPLVVSHLFLF